MHKPLLSIVTPCLNRAGMIRDAIESVCKQNYDHIEHIIVDGGSRDGTLDILKEYKHLKVISEPDKNLYDGLNKGIKLAKGELIAHLNSDDCFEENCFHEIVELFNRNQQIDSVCGGASVYEQKENNLKFFKAIYNKPRYKSLNLPNITYGMPIINARIFRKAVYDKIGHYNIQYRIAADREFLLRAYLAGINTLNMDKVIYHYRHHTGSLTINDTKTQLNDDIHPEYLDILSHYQNLPKLPKEIYQACRNWHTWMLGYNMLSYIKAMDIASGFRMLKKGHAQDPLFLPRYIVQKIRNKDLGS